MGVRVGIGDWNAAPGGGIYIGSRSNVGIRPRKNIDMIRVFFASGGLVRPVWKLHIVRLFDSTIYFMSALSIFYFIFRIVPIKDLKSINILCGRQLYTNR